MGPLVCDKKLGLGAVLGCLLGASSVLAAPHIAHNGGFWHQLNAPTKEAYVAGYADAMDISTARLEPLALAAEMLHWSNGRKIVHQLQHDLAIPDRARNQAVPGLDRLYADPRYGELEIGIALQLLASRIGSEAPQMSPATTNPGKPALRWTTRRLSVRM